LGRHVSNDMSLPKTLDDRIEGHMSEDVELPPETKASLRKHWDEMHGRRWIPVSERLPEPGQQVLAAIPPRVWNEENQAIIETLDYEQESFYSWKDDEWQKRVTHWMPLPEPPEVR
jgi:hypothetical protein